MDRDLVVDRGVGCEHRGAGTNARAAVGFNDYSAIRFLMIGVGAASKNSAAAALDRSDQAADIFERMEPGLVGEAQCSRAVWQPNRCIVSPLHLHAELAARVKFLFEVLLIRKLGGHQISIQPAKIGIDVFVAADGFDAVDRRDLALVIEP